MMAQHRRGVHIRHVIAPRRDLPRRLDVRAPERVAVEAFTKDPYLGQVKQGGHVAERLSGERWPWEYARVRRNPHRPKHGDPRQAERLRIVRALFQK